MQECLVRDCPQMVLGVANKKKRPKRYITDNGTANSKGVVWMYPSKDVHKKCYYHRRFGGD